jgi:photosystem II stability/assembly factor-like uncharacterized protein
LIGGSLPLESMPYALAASAGELFAAFADGRLFLSADMGDSWSELPLRLEAIRAMALD